MSFHHAQADESLHAVAVDAAEPGIVDARRRDSDVTEENKPNDEDDNDGCEAALDLTELELFNEVYKVEDDGSGFRRATGDELGSTLRGAENELDTILGSGSGGRCVSVIVFVTG